MQKSEKSSYTQNSTYNPGYIECIVGTMYSGKTREVIYRGRKAEKFGAIEVQYFKPNVDTKHNGVIKCRDGEEEEAITFKKSHEILDKANKEASLILIDEAQFSDNLLPFVVQSLKSKGHNIVVSGLIKDFRAQPFSVMAKLMAMADVPAKVVFSVCSSEGCQNDGVFAQRFRNNEPDSALSPTVIIEGSNELISYEPRCVNHHFVPDIQEYLERKINEEKQRQIAKQVIK